MQFSAGWNRILTCEKSVQVDDNGDGVLQFEEFCRLLAQVCKISVLRMSVGFCVGAGLYVRLFVFVCMRVFAMIPSASTGGLHAEL